MKMIFNNMWIFYLFLLTIALALASVAYIAWMKDTLIG